jgi:hypothetical protein
MRNVGGKEKESSQFADGRKRRQTGKDAENEE